MAAAAVKMQQTAHTAGLFADRALDGPEIGTLVAVIDRARNLPNRKTIGKQDPYCAMRLGKEAKKTETDRRGGQTPKWDQELRFTVHESLDYYKLKCSVFNEDKRNDLIGEKWIDLKDVIIPGGGSNDLWHQLHFKGKYAGELRVELTYYDTRPKDETVLEKRRERERLNSNGGSSPTVAGVAGTRQLAPREVKRRPLPQGPPGSSPAVRPPMPEQVHSSPMPALWHAQSGNDHPQRYDMWAPDQHYHTDPDDGQIQYQPPHENGRSSHQRPFIDDQGYPRQRDLAYRQEAFDEEPVYPSIESSQLQEASYSDASLPLYDFSPATPLSNTTPNYDERRHSAQSSFPDRSSYDTSSPHGTSPLRPGSGAVRSSPGSSDPIQRALANRYSTSPTKNDSYRDSPLRQSISHRDIDAALPPSQESNHDGGPPPPPPTHRNHTAPQMPPSPSYPHKNSMQVHRHPQPPYFSPMTFSPDARSPLQTIERNFDPYYKSSPASAGGSRQQGSLDAYTKPSYGPPDPQQRTSTYPRPRSNGENAPPPDDGGFRLSMQVVDESMAYDDDDIYRQHHSSTFIGRTPQQQLYDLPNYREEQHTYRSHPQIVRPRAISPGAYSTPTRKSISPHANPSSEERRLSATPYGPESYDVLNPLTASAPASNAAAASVETPERAREAARLREVEKLREQSPIIGNDGREIDPSDHLPSDTWAPEPERKHRKPEHVIRFRTKDEALRIPNKVVSSPTSSRPVSMPVTAYNSSPLSAGSPSGGEAARIGRNRLQKQMPSRPLPVQPFQHAQSSPAVPMSQPAPEHDSPPWNMHSTSPTGSYGASAPRTNRGPHRPALSEYPIMANRDVGSSPHERAHSQGPPPIPAKIPLYETPVRRPYGDMDALSWEMSSIDIGTGSGGRSYGRSRRVFEV